MGCDFSHNLSLSVAHFRQIEGERRILRIGPPRRSRRKMAAPKPDDPNNTVALVAFQQTFSSFTIESEFSGAVKPLKSGTT
jgi:hypothetical protein